MSLISDNVNNQRFVVEPIEENDVRPALKSLPCGVSAMILHRKCRLGREMVIETTLIRKGCVDEEFTLVLFIMDAINAWLPTSRTKPVVNLIAIERFNSEEHSQQITQPTAMITNLAQQSGYSHNPLPQSVVQTIVQNEQLSQLSQNSAAHNPMQPLFWNRMNVMYPSGTQMPTQPNVFDMFGGHL
jgi:hypothetical protein